MENIKFLRVHSILYYVFTTCNVASGYHFEHEYMYGVHVHHC
jgi:hypothetical protein